jgi:uncharacterized membrane protein
MDMDRHAAATAVLRRTRALAVGATVALIVLGVAWELWLAPTGRGTLALKVVPLLFPLPGLVRMRLYTYRWLSLALWFYAAEGCVRATSERGLGSSLAALELTLSLVLFAACCVHLRARLRAATPAHPVAGAP